ncbi:MAG: Ser/Thr protein kinase RdoA (MazF antagonist) [Myxococcota bacterium]|jgi:Ser/Thr protein kinase RdoA (MazF antagonist)
MLPALSLWSLADAVASPLADGGLINETFAVDVRSARVGYLQRLNTGIFVPEVHHDIEAVTTHLAAVGVSTPRILRTAAGALWHTDPGGGVWRLLTPVGDRTVHSLEDPADARSAGALVARWHAALGDLEWEFHSVRAGAHDTDAHLAGLVAAVEAHPDHRLAPAVAPLAARIAEGWRTWNGPTELPARVIHGDLKVSNIRFIGSAAHALIDLDTCAWGTLDIELGDALRSWCNPASEDVEAPTWRLDIFSAAMHGYASHSALSAEEWSAVVPGCERICWELAARFARDALEERYFGWNPRFGGRGEHNLLRARGQAALAASVRQQRGAAEAILRAL